MGKQQVTYLPVGNVCSKRITIEAEYGKILTVNIEGGCHGNLQGISSLLKGMDLQEAIMRMEGIDCRGRGTSCPDQIAQALKQFE